MPPTISQPYAPAWRSCAASDRRCRLRKAICRRNRRSVMQDMDTGHSERSALREDRSDNPARYGAVRSRAVFSSSRKPLSQHVGPLSQVRFFAGSALASLASVCPHAPPRKSKRDRGLVGHCRNIHSRLYTEGRPREAVASACVLPFLGEPLAGSRSSRRSHADKGCHCVAAVVGSDAIIRCWRGKSWLQTRYSRRCES